MEYSVVANPMLPLLMDYLLYDLRGAHRHGRSADQILLYAVDKIVKAVDSGNCVYH